LRHSDSVRRKQKRQNKRMSDSGMSIASSSTSEDNGHNHELELDETETCRENNFVSVVHCEDKEENYDDNIKISPPKTKPKPYNSFLSKSVMNLASSIPYLPPSISRSDSISSVASNFTSPVTALEIRTLTNNFQKLLKQATREIKKLNLEKSKLELEQEKLLTVNVDMAIETKKLLLNQKEWQKDKQDLIQANEEFASEVEKLYKAEVQQDIDKEKMTKELKENQDKFVIDNRHLEAKREETEKIELQINQLKQFLEASLLENGKLQVLQSSYVEDTANFETKVEDLMIELAEEKELRGEDEMHIKKLSQELENMKSEQKAFADDYKESKNETEEHNKEEDDLRRKVTEQQEQEVDQLKVENQWLVKSQRNTADRMHVKEGEVEVLKKELQEEKEKVKSMTSWKLQLLNKNKDLKEDNERLFRRAEDLERLMNMEVKDINEIITVIDTIQEDKKIPEMKSNNYF